MDSLICLYKILRQIGLVRASFSWPTRAGLARAAAWEENRETGQAAFLLQALFSRFLVFPFSPKPSFFAFPFFHFSIFSFSHFPQAIFSCFCLFSPCSTFPYTNRIHVNLGISYHYFTRARACAYCMVRQLVCTLNLWPLARIRKTRPDPTLA